MSVFPPSETQDLHDRGLIGNASPTAARDGWLDGRMRSLVLGRLGDLTSGQLLLSDGGRRYAFGSHADLRAHLHVKQPRFYRRVALGGAIGAAESYMDGDWTTDDLLAVIRIFARNSAAAEKLNRSNPLVTLGSRILHWLNRNTQQNSRRNIAAHYDLGDEFFRLFLDETMTYSCGLFANDETSMAEASLAKIDRLCSLLELAPEDHLLEIGSGWGALSLRAAEKYGCRVTTTTISAKQFAHVSQRVAERQLSHRITVLNTDYRNLSGKFDKLVSVEMIEAVGHEFLPTYFAKCAELLRPSGLAAIQAITIPDARYHAYRRRVDFIQKYIFPGGCLPSCEEISRVVSRDTTLQIESSDDFTEHYATTLRNWRNQFWHNIEQVRALGLPESFLRMWDWYFCYCEGAFRERQIGLAQILLKKSG